MLAQYQTNIGWLSHVGQKGLIYLHMLCVTLVFYFITDLSDTYNARWQDSGGGGYADDDGGCGGDWSYSSH